MPVYGAFQTKLGLSKETTPGTPVGATPNRWLPADAPKVRDNIPWYEDKGYRGIAAETFGHYQLQSPGAEISIPGPFYPDSVAAFLWGVYGADTITAAPASTTTTGTNNSGQSTLTITSGAGSVNGMAILIGSGATQEANIILAGGGTTTLTLAGPLRNTQTAGATVAYNTLHTLQLAAAPPTFTFWDFYGPNWRQYVYAFVDKFDLKWTAAAQATYVASLKAFLSTVPSTPGASSFTTVPPFVGWQSGVAIAGTAETDLEELDISFDRVISPVPGANNSLNPVSFFASTLAVTGRAVVQMGVDTWYNYYRNATFSKFQFFLFGPAPGVQGAPGASGLAFTASQPAYTMAEIDRSKEWVHVQVDFTADYSATDAGPGQVQLCNNIAAALA